MDAQRAGHDDDNLSVSSTISAISNSDEEWTVEGLLAEGLVDGEIHYLVEWQGFPLASATWEPQEHLNEELLQTWSEKKARIALGKEERFKIRAWNEAVERALKDKHARHLKRNALRESRGILPTEWDAPLESKLQDMRAYWPKDDPNDDVFFSRGQGVDPEQQDNPPLQQNKSQSAIQSPSSSQKSSSLPVTFTRDQNSSPKTLQKRPSSAENDQPTKERPTKTLKTQFKAQKDNKTKGLDSTIQQQPRKTKNLASSGSGPQPSTNANNSSTIPDFGLQQPKLAARNDTKKVPSPAKSSPVQSAKSLPSKGPKAASKAIRSLTTKGLPTGNVFSGGITRKKKKTIREAASDGTSPSKMLKSRFTRLIENQSRDVENQAPPQMPRNLIVLDSQAPRMPLTVSPTQSPSGKSDSMIQAKDTPTKPTRKSSLKQSTVSASAAQIARRKSVQFSDNVQTNTFESQDYIDSEPSLFIEDPFRATSIDNIPEEDVPTDERFRYFRGSPPPRGQEPLHLQAAMESIAKPCDLGSSEANPIALLFKGLPGLHKTFGGSGLSFMADFKDRTSLVFSHMCIADDFGAQFRNAPDMSQNLASGTVTAVTDPAALERVASRLKLGAFGILCHTPGYCILLFPSKTGEWDFEESQISKDDGPLNYVIFSNHDFPPDDFDAGNGPGAEAQSWEKVLPEALSQFASLKYNCVVPSAMQALETHHIYLAFPQTALQELRLISQWLVAASNAKCVLYDSHTYGDWDRFVAVSCKRAMVVHEDVLSRVRLFSGIFHLLQQVPDGRFCLSIFRGYRECSELLDMSLDSARSCDFGPRRIFPHYKAFLMTPSFIVSQPQQAYVFFSYFLKSYAQGDPKHHAKLIVPADFEDWLVGLIAARTRFPIQRNQKTHEADMSALSKLLQHFSSLSETVPDNEPSSSLSFAPNSIDGNDEQSLVNWFGWWTIRNLERYGRCYVIGSGHSVGEEAMVLQIKPPKYTLSTVDDTDHVQATVEREVARINRSTNSEAGTAVETTSGFPRDQNLSRLVNEQDPSDLRRHLQDLMAQVKTWPVPFWLNFNPVSYWEDGMEFKLSDIRGNFRSYRQWFDSLLPFDKLRHVQTQHGPLRNTLGGFFWTPESDFEERLRKSEPITKHPWLAFFRPCRPYIPASAWKDSELLIWDPRYSCSFGERNEIHDRELLEPHRRLVDLIDLSNKEKNPNQPLRNVWVFGEPIIRTNYSSNLDIVLETLEAISKNPKDRLPANSRELEESHWKRVRPDLVTDSDGDREPMELDSKTDSEGSLRSENGQPEMAAEDFEEADTKTIFLPPRGQRRQDRNQRQRSLCRNMLYKSCTTLTPDRITGAIQFKFEPTKMWYGQQVNEARDFKHIMVENWYTIFRLLDLPTD